MAQEERRNDIGSKIMTGIVVGAFVAVLTLSMNAFFAKTYDLAEKSYAMGMENCKDIAVLQESQRTIAEGIKGINTKLDRLLN